MIVLAYSATLIALLTLVALSVLINIDDDRKVVAPRVF